VGGVGGEQKKNAVPKPIHDPLEPKAYSLSTFNFQLSTFN
jgi:hypothetical protein